MNFSTWVAKEKVEFELRAVSDIFVGKVELEGILQLVHAYILQLEKVPLFVFDSK